MTWKVATGKKGQRSPPPLPMYERVVLKHVPTMVRRKYDKNLNIIDENQENNEDNDGVEEDFDNGFEDSEGEDDTLSSLDYDHDSQSSMDNYASNNVESSSSSKYSNENTSEDDGAQDDVYLASSEDATGVDDNVMEQANATLLPVTCSNECEKGDGDNDVDRVMYVDASVVEKEAHENEHDCESKGEGVEDANVSVQGGEIQDIEHKNLDDEQDDNESESDGSEDNQSLASEYRDGSVKDEVQGNQHVHLENQQGSCIESCKDNESDGIRDVNGSSHYAEINNPKHEAEDKEQGNSDDNIEAKEYHSPAPLPMYERVLLKHVPTIVRRRYDKDINKSDALSGLSEEDGKNEGEGAEDVLRSTTTSDVDDNSCDDEATLEIEHHTQTYATEDFQHNNNFESSTKEINKEDVTEHSSNVSSVDVGVEDKLPVQERSKLDLNDQGSFSKDVEEEDERARDDVSLASDVDASVKIEPENSEQVSCLKDRDVEVEEDDGAKDVNLSSDVDASVKHEVNDEQGLHLEDCKTQGDGANGTNNGAKDVDVANYYVEEGVKNREFLEDLEKHEKFDNKQGLHKENCKSEGDGIRKTNVVTCYKNGSIQDEVWDNDDRCGDFGSKHDTKIALFGNDDLKNLLFSNLPSFPSISRCVTTTRLIQVQWNNFTSTNFHKLNFDGSCTPSLVVMGIVIRDSHGSILSAKAYKMGRTTSVVAQAMAIRKGLVQLRLSNRYVEGDYPSIIIRSIYHDYQRTPWNLQFLVEDFKHLPPRSFEITARKGIMSYLIPEVFMKTLERDGYDLYCPNCKHSITHNMIFRRRVDDEQQCKTTCFSFLISLFCCNRMNRW